MDVVIWCKSQRVCLEESEAAHWDIASTAVCFTQAAFCSCLAGADPPSPTFGPEPRSSPGGWLKFFKCSALLIILAHLIYLYIFSAGLLSCRGTLPFNLLKDCDWFSELVRSFPWPLLLCLESFMLESQRVKYENKLFYSYSCAILCGSPLLLSG